MSEIDPSNRSGIQVPEIFPERVLIEGGDHGAWDLIQLEHQVLMIPQGITKFRFDGYQLTLVARWSGYKIKPVPAHVYELGRHGGIIDRPIYPTEGWVGRPRTFLTEGGRIFHDISLWDNTTKFNNGFLDRFLDRLQDKYGAENPLIHQDNIFPEYTFDASFAGLI